METDDFQRSPDPMDNQKLCVVQLNDFDWWIGYSLEQCVQDYSQEYGSHQCLDPFVLSESELTTTIFTDDETDTQKTFAEQLEVERQLGGSFPRFFATTEQ